jgi:hypothetical protein
MALPGPSPALQRGKIQTKSIRFRGFQTKTYLAQAMRGRSKFPAAYRMLFA